MEDKRMRTANKDLLKKKLKEAIFADRAEIRRNRPYQITSKGLR